MANDGNIDTDEFKLDDQKKGTYILDFTITIKIFQGPSY